jgi:ribosomal protein S18 acetylase RimI-like enzyme
MKDPDLLNATGSEPLSFEEEIAMQQSWRDDPNKCTFIVLQRCEEVETDLADESHHHDFIQRTLQFIIGDVNLFLSCEEHEDEAENDFKAPQDETASLLQAEIDIMIAEPNCRSRGLGREACSLMIMYGAQQVGIRRFFCKIQETNKASLALFESLGFVECGYTECFREFELELKRDTAIEILSIMSEFLGAKELTKFACRLDLRDGADDNRYSI